ncbi:OmpA family protein [Gilvibacter sediminis]|uniref:OmpA family protein n=1 Tax=Gilvibacter sediminis TaxID=379071 RepID=UPI00235072EF|nr:OmpA family protein [Gilvibacter sediminis]MDC7998281.1 OmpA family protein [Gilvibacter sediminis]
MSWTKTSAQQDSIEQLEKQVTADTITTTLAVQDTLITAEANPSLEGLVGKDAEGTTIFYFDQGLRISKNDSLVYSDASNLDYKYKILNYLLEHPDREVTILSRYSADEDFRSPNFGVIRGEFIKEELVAAGVPREVIVIKSDIQDIDFDSQNSFDNGISFKFGPLDTERVAALATAIPKNKVVYPTFTNSGILVNNALKNTLEEIKTVLEERPEITVKIVGHTDNIGNYQDNYNLGLKYARQVRWYFISRGSLDKTRLMALSKGESEPIDSNNSQRGRDLNRRIEIIFN